MLGPTKYSPAVARTLIDFLIARDRIALFSLFLTPLITALQSAKFQITTNT